VPIITGGSTGGSSSGGGLTLLNPSTYQLGADGTFDFQNLSQAYNDLHCRGFVRATVAAVAENVAMRVNNDSSAAYLRANTHNFNGTVAGSAFGAAQTSAYVFDAPGASATANRWTSLEVDIIGYKTTNAHKNILCRFMEYDGTTGEWGEYINIWTNTAAITRIGLFGLTTANLLAGSQFRIYGLL